MALHWLPTQMAIKVMGSNLARSSEMRFNNYVYISFLSSASAPKARFETEVNFQFFYNLINYFRHVRLLISLSNQFMNTI